MGIASPPEISEITIDRLTPPQIRQRTTLIIDMLKLAYGESYNPEVGGSTITDMYSGAVQIWEITSPGEDKPHFMGMFTTRIVDSQRYGRRSLYVEMLSSYERLSIKAWECGAAMVEAYARVKGCSIIEADVMNAKVIRQAVRLGFKTASVRILKEL